jgi:hypothetical protein
MAVQTKPFQKYGLIPVADPDTIIDPDAMPIGVVVLGTSVKILSIVVDPDIVVLPFTLNEPVIFAVDPDNVNFELDPDNINCASD